jgi:hypothetical protein
MHNVASERLVDAIITHSASLIKHPGFKDEGEQRISIAPSDALLQYIKFRTGAYGITRYVELENETDTFEKSERNRLPIKEIYIGPTGSTEFAEAELRAFLETNGYGHVNIRQSGLPLR